MCPASTTKADLIIEPLAPVADVFARYPDDKRERLFELRALILQIGTGLYGSASIVESLKWGEPAYRPLAKHPGVTVRLHWKPKFGDQAGLFFNCNTSLISEFRELYGDILSFEGNRCLWIPLDAPYPEDAVAHCVSMAFRYGK
ncbi:DUF1801 domain-containing protein [Pseudovibrio sp. Tun.PSC04-5.I4]|uniref:DUF1801 domain-containing protein n=1 Tax=Pseudovibrio sp. Tun.PSC04-5.I4 TaxID=1798213 RepID=UPI0008878D82|nr:DUF1801 domain-containing protein [Pseudovibrio sp. Tun.PSC04-5.I4]SDQ95484.1 protein of unknown function (DU1801) [Pseudovibrio sp. Tun.PSC04-5.I4]